MTHFDKWDQQAEAAGGGVLSELNAAAKDAFKLTRAVLVALTTSKRRGAEEIAKVIGKPIGDVFKKAGKLQNKDRNKRDHAKAVIDGLNLLQWYLQADKIEFAKEHAG